jgi:hypothetical protein
MTTNLEKINAELIEKGAIIVGRIYALKEEYRLRLIDVEKKIKRLYETEGIDDNNFQFYGGLRVQLESSLRDLEELTK